MTRAYAIPAHPDELGLTRRSQLTGLFAAFMSYALAGEVAAARPQRRMAASDWIDRHGELARSLKLGETTPLGWMAEVERLAREIDVAELMAEVRRARITPAPPPTTNDPQKRSIRFVDSAGTPRQLGYAAALFDFAPFNVITPHGHRNMVSAHLIADGSFRVRNFDRIGDRDGAMIIRPTRDGIVRTGEISTMSSTRDNIHWFVPVGGSATTFDVIVSALDRNQPDFDIAAIDPIGGRRLPNGAILAPVISFEAASAKYTAKV